MGRDPADLAPGGGPLPALPQVRGPVGQPERPGGAGRPPRRRRRADLRPARDRLFSVRRARAGGGRALGRRRRCGRAPGPGPRRGRGGARGIEPPSRRGRYPVPPLLERPPRTERGDHRHQLRPRLLRIRPRPGVPRHLRPPGERLPDNGRVLAGAERPHRGVQRARPLRDPSRLRMVRQHLPRGRPQRLVPARGTPHLPLLPGPRLRHVASGDRLPQREGPPRRPPARGRARHRAHRRALRRRQVRPRREDRAFGRDPLRLGGPSSGSSSMRSRRTTGSE